MALACILKVIFLVFLLGTIGATIFGLVSESWETVRDENGTIHRRGLFKGCIKGVVFDKEHVKESAKISAHAVIDSYNPCAETWMESEMIIKVVTGLVAGSAALQAAALIYTIVSFFFGCWCNMFIPAAVFTILAGLLNIGSVVAFYMSSKEGFKENLKRLNIHNEESEQSFFNVSSYALFIQIGVGVFLIVIMTAFAVAIQKMGKKDPEAGEHGTPRGRGPNEPNTQSSQA